MCVVACLMLTRSEYNLSVVTALHKFKCKAHAPAPTSKHRSSSVLSITCHRHRAMRWESSVLNWGVCLDRLDKYFFSVVVSSPLFSPDSHRRGSAQPELRYIMGWVAVLSKKHGCLTSCPSVYTAPLAVGIN